MASLFSRRKNKPNQGAGDDWPAPLTPAAAEDAEAERNDSGSDDDLKAGAEKHGEEIEALNNMRLRASPEAPPASPLTDAAPRLDSAAALDPRLNLVAMQAAMQAELLAIQPVVGGTSGPTSPISPKKRQSIWARALEATVNHAAVATAALETATENATRAIETASENAARAIEQAAENATRAIETAADRAAMRKEDAKADAKANNALSSAHETRAAFDKRGELLAATALKSEALNESAQDYRKMARKQRETAQKNAAWWGIS